MLYHVASLGKSLGSERHNLILHHFLGPIQAFFFLFPFVFHVSCATCIATACGFTQLKTFCSSLFVLHESSDYIFPASLNDGFQAKEHNYCCQKTVLLSCLFSCTFSFMIPIFISRVPLLGRTFALVADSMQILQWTKCLILFIIDQC